jgi:hypothetical protein
MVIADRPLDNSTLRLADMMTPEEGMVVRAAYAESATFSDMVAIGEATMCHLCAIPLSLRDPDVTWPTCTHD